MQYTKEVFLCQVPVEVLAAEDSEGAEAAPVVSGAAAPVVFGAAVPVVFGAAVLAAVFVPVPGDSVPADLTLSPIDTSGIPWALGTADPWAAVPY